MKAILIYKNEISGELYTEDELENMNEWIASELMHEIVNSQGIPENIIKFNGYGRNIEVMKFRWIKEGDRYSLFRLLGLELKE